MAGKQCTPGRVTGGAGLVSAGAVASRQGSVLRDGLQETQLVWGQRSEYTRLSLPCSVLLLSLECMLSSPRDFKPLGCPGPALELPVWMWPGQGSLQGAL